VSSTPIPGSENIKELCSGPKLNEYWQNVTKKLEDTGNVKVFYEHNYDFKDAPEKINRLTDDGLHRFKSNCGEREY
jgi:hypothetical protein